MREASRALRLALSRRMSDIVPPYLTLFINFTEVTGAGEAEVVVEGADWSAMSTSG